MKTLVISEDMGGMTLEAHKIENYPGFIDGISGFDLVNRMVEQAKKFKGSMQDVKGIFGV